MSIVKYSLDRLNKLGGHAFTLLVHKMRSLFTVPDYSFIKVWKGVDVFTQERTVMETHHNSFLEIMLPVRYWCFNASRGTPPAFVF